MKKLITSFLLIIAATTQVWGVVYSTELQRAAEAGDMVSQYKLANCYRYGYGVDIDMITTAYWYKKAADQGDGYSQCALGNLYYMGEGVGKDDKAFKLLKEAAENEIQPSGDAMNLLSSCYRFGLGTAKDINKADYWLNKSKETDSDMVVMIMQALSEK